MQDWPAFSPCSICAMLWPVLPSFSQMVLGFHQKPVRAPVLVTHTLSSRTNLNKSSSAPMRSLSAFPGRLKGMDEIPLRSTIFCSPSSTETKTAFWLCAETEYELFTGVKKTVFKYTVPPFTALGQSVA